MPVPKGKQKLYGKIVGANINKGKSMDQAKDIADEAVTAGRSKKSKKSKKSKNSPTVLNSSAADRSQYL